MRRETVFRERSEPLEINSSQDIIGRFHLSKETILSLTDDQTY